MTSATVLRDGGSVRVEPVEPDERAAMVDAARGLAPQHADAWSSDAASDLLAATTGEDRRVVAIARADDANDEVADLAVVVDPAWHGRGVATAMIEALTARARGRGIRELRATVAADDTLAQSVLASLGFERDAADDAAGAGVHRLRVDSSPSFLPSHDARLHTASIASLEPMLHPRSVAVIGASHTPGRVGSVILSHLVEGDFTGDIYPINPKGGTIAGLPALTSVADAPSAPDLAVICVKSDYVLDAARDALRAGTRALCVISAGFAEVGEEGRARQAELRDLVIAHGARLLGPNCLGLAVAEGGLDATFAPRRLPPGNIACASQSGAIGLALLERAGTRGFGFHAFVSLGNKADVSSNDLLEFWEDEDDAAAIVLYVESFGNPRRLGRIARRVARKRPIIALQGGTTTSGSAAARSHTAALASSTAVTDALFRDAGIIRAANLEELVDLTSYFASQPIPAGNRVAIVTNAGGLGILAADAADAAGLQLAMLSDETRRALAAVLDPAASVANPVDMLGSGTAAELRASIELVLVDPGVDAVVVAFTPPATLRFDDAEPAIGGAVAHCLETHPQTVDKPVLAALVTDRHVPAITAGSRQVATFAYPELAIRSLGAAARHRTWLDRVDDEPQVLGGRPVDVVGLRSLARTVLERRDDGWVTTDEANELLELLGLTAPASEHVASSSEAGRAFRRMDGPVAVKVAADTTATHKSDVGGVVLDIRSEDEVIDVARAMGGDVLVQQMAPHGAELMCGVLHDPRFGPLVTLGPGGTLAELVGHAEFRIAPLTSSSIDELLGAHRTRMLLDGYRNMPGADMDEMRDLLVRISTFADLVPELAELDLNPLILTEDGCVVVDLRARFAPIGEQIPW